MLIEQSHKFIFYSYSELVIFLQNSLKRTFTAFTLCFLHFKRRQLQRTKKEAPLQLYNVQELVLSVINFLSLYKVSIYTLS